MTRLGKPFDFSARDELLRNPENAAVYLEEILESGNMELFHEALRNVAKTQEGGSLNAKGDRKIGLSLK